MFAEIKKKILSEKVNVYQAEISMRNYKCFDSFAIVGIIIAFCVLIYGIIMNHVVTFNAEFFVIFTYFSIMLLFSRLLLKRWKKYATLAFYISLTPPMLWAIMMGTFADPTQPSITIMVLICVLPIFILDKPWRVIAYITGVAVIYTVCCYIAKDSVMFVEDMIDLVAFYFLAVGVNCFSLNDRISSVENFIKFREKSEKDLLSGLYNRGTGVEKIESLLQQGVHGAFIVIDVDRFKMINDSYGHLVGDKLLQAVADTLTTVFTTQDIVLRLGGDEFAIYAVGLEQKELCQRKIEHLMTAIKQIKIEAIKENELSISVGGARYYAENHEFEYLYKQADQCLYQAKNLGKGQYCIGD